MSEIGPFSTAKAKDAITMETNSKTNVNLLLKVLRPLCLEIFLVNVPEFSFFIGVDKKIRMKRNNGFYYKAAYRVTIPFQLSN